MAETGGATVTTRGVRNEQTRRHNLSIVLESVHRDGPLSSAELTRLTGLNRSTVRALVRDLADADLVFETAPAESAGVGRPSPLVNVSDAPVAIAVNPDVDAVNVGIVGLGGRVLAQQVARVREVPTPGRAAEEAAQVADRLLGSLGPRRVVGVGVAVPGLVQQGTGIVVRAPHLGWADEPVADVFAARLDAPVAVGNDAALGLIAETRFGAARGIDDLIYLNGSTSGIGGAALVGGRLLTGAHGYAGEFGHMLVDSVGATCDCGRRGCLEAEVNVQRLDAAAGVTEHAPGAYDEGFDGQPPAVAVEVARQADLLATAIANLAGVFNPDVVTLGGFLGAVFDAHRDDVTANVKDRAFRPLADDLEIERTRLREGLLLVGAAELAFASLMADPLGTPE